MYYFSCPSCKNNSQFYKLRRESKRSNASLGILLTGGVLASLLFLRYENRKQIQCAQCKFTFYQPPIGRSPVATAAMILLYCMLISILIGVTVEAIQKGYWKASNWRYIETVQDYVSLHPIAFGVGSIACFVMVTLLSILMCLIANFRHGRRIRAEYESRPTEYPPHSVLEPSKPTIPTDCPQCQYNLTGNVSGTCPECGTKFLEEISGA
jgi:hypothetical protein